MNKNINRKNIAMMIQTIRRVSVYLLILGALSSCAKESLVDNGSEVGVGHTLTLRIAPTVVPISETKATVRAAGPGSEAAAAGFSYELVSSNHTDSTATELFSSPVTKAPSGLKNVYALLFTETGAFNGRASIGKEIVNNEALDITFTDVGSTTSANCRLVIVANDGAAANSYKSTGGTGGFSNFKDTYTKFQALIMTNPINTDADIPYAGTTTVNIANGEVGKLVEIDLYRTLASIKLNNNFNVTGGTPAMKRTKVELHNAGGKRFAPVGAGDNYNGSSATLTPTENLVAGPSVANANSGDDFHFYVGENVRPAGNSSITTQPDRNTTKAPEKSSYLRITSNTVQAGANTNPKIGEEYITQNTTFFTYDIYLGKSDNVRDFSLRRNTNYTITSSIIGTVNTQEVLASVDKRITQTLVSAGESAGLVIGRFGGFNYQPGGGATIPDVSGQYTKLLLLQPNTSGSTAVDNVSRVWGPDNGRFYQPHSRRYWDKSYIYGITQDGTVGGMNASSGYLYDYCRSLTLGGVEQGTWYVPTLTQLMAMWTVLEGLKYRNYFSRYSGINNPSSEAQYSYWSCTEGSETRNYVPYVAFFHGYIGSMAKWRSQLVRCVRDL